MTLSPSAASEIQTALDQVRDKALDIPTSGDLDAMRRALSGVRQAILYATETINLAERDARWAALNKLENAA